MLLKEVFHSIPTYTMNCLLIPKSLCEEMKAHVSRFWWGQRQDGLENNRIRELSIDFEV